MELRAVKGVSSPTEVSDVIDIEIVNTANPFGDYGLLWVDDFGGDKRDSFQAGDRLDFQVKESDEADTAYRTKVPGFVVNTRETERNGGEVLEVEAYSLDQLIRRGKVRDSLAGKSIKGALEEIIKTYTAVTWDASLVDVVDKQTLTQSYENERIDSVIRSLSLKSGNESFGVTEKAKFFFRSQDTSRAQRDISNSEWTAFDLPEKDKDRINQVEVYYDDGSNFVTVDESKDREELEDQIGTERPVAFSTQVMREDIKSPGNARAVGREILEDQDTANPWEVTTIGVDVADMKPGKVLNVNIIPQGINNDYEIVETKYRYAPDVVELTVREKKGDQSPLLRRVSDTLKQVEMRPTQDDATEQRFINIESGITLEPTLEFEDSGGSIYQADRLRITNTFLDLIRDNYIDGTGIGVDAVGLGSDDTAPKRTNTGLGNFNESFPLLINTTSQNTYSYHTGTADVTVTEAFSEIGVKDPNGNLLVRGVFPAGVPSGDGTINFDITTSNNPDKSGIATDRLETTTLQLIDDTAYDEADVIGVGNDETALSQTQTSLANEIDRADIGTEIIQTADTTREWKSVGNLGKEVAATIEGDTLRTAQSCFVAEAESNVFDDTAVISDSDFSDGQGVKFSNEHGHQFTFDIDLDYRIPDGDVKLKLRTEAVTSYPLYVYVDGAFSDRLSSPTKTLEWEKLNLSGDLSAGSHTILVDGSADITGEVDVDIVALYDDRFNYNFANTVGTNGHLAGPELYPDVEKVDFATEETNRDVSEATLTQSWNDTSNGQFLALSNDGTNYSSTSNTQSTTESFGSPSEDVDVRIGLSRFGSRTTATPTSGFNAQEVADSKLFADVGGIYPTGIGSVEVRTNFAENTLSNGPLKEAGQIDTGNILLTRSIFADIPIVTDRRIIPVETLDWKDIVEVEGATNTIFSVSIASTNSPITATEALDVKVDVENVGGVSGDQDIFLLNFDGTVVDQQTGTLNVGESKTITLTWNTTSTDGGTDTIKVQSYDDTDTKEVTVDAYESGRWTKTTNSDPLAVAYDPTRGFVIAGDATGNVYQIRTSDGTYAGQTTAPGGHETNDIAYDPASDAYFSAHGLSFDDRGAFKIDPDSMSVTELLPNANVGFDKLAVGNGTAVFGEVSSSAGDLYGIDTSAESVDWTSAVDFRTGGGAAAYEHQGLAYARDLGGFLWSNGDGNGENLDVWLIDPSNGSKLWKDSYNEAVRFADVNGRGFGWAETEIREWDAIGNSTQITTVSTPVRSIRGIDEVEQFVAADNTDTFDRYDDTGTKLQSTTMNAEAANGFQVRRIATAENNVLGVPVCKDDGDIEQFEFDIF